MPPADRSFGEGDRDAALGTVMRAGEQVSASGFEQQIV